MVAAKNTAGPLAAIASRNQRQNFTSFAFGALVFEGGGPQPLSRAAPPLDLAVMRLLREIPPIAFLCSQIPLEPKLQVAA